MTAGLDPGQTGETSTDPNGNITTKVFDKAGRLISVTADGQTTSYTYYDNGSKHMVIYPDGSTEEYTYYDDNLLYTLVNKKADQTIIDSYTYTYDAAHNMASKVDSKGTTSYTYDDLERLLTVTEPSTQVTTYAYDAAGNRASQTVTLSGDSTATEYTYNSQNRLTDSMTKLNNVITQAITYIYDNNGNQTTVTTTPYDNGIPQTPDTLTYSYDTLNQLITTATSGGAILTNTYNGEGKRVAKQAGTATIRYLYEGNDVVLEEDGSGNQLARNVWGTSLISRNVSGTVLYYMYNGHADVTALIDASGTIQATYYYDAFGNILEGTGTVDNPFKYAGYQYDDETGLYYLQSRYYDPLIARFITEDTYRGTPNDPLSLNLYTYCHNEPLMYTDPDGHSWKSFKKAVKKAVTSAKKTVVKKAAEVKKAVTKAVTPAKTSPSKSTTAVKSNASTTNKGNKAAGSGSAGTNKGSSVKTGGNPTTAYSNRGGGSISTKKTSTSDSPSSKSNTKADTTKNSGGGKEDKPKKSPSSGKKENDTSRKNNSLNQWEISKVGTIGNATGTVSGSMDVLSETGKRYIPESIQKSVRPNNIGTGTWNKAIASEMKTAEMQLGTVTKIAKGGGVAAVGLDVGVGIYENVQAGAPTKKIVSDATVDTAFGLGGLAASMGAGALYGSVVPGAGTLAGAVVGLGVGVGYMVATEIWEPYGKSIKDRVKEGVYNSSK